MCLGQKDVVPSEDGWPLRHDILATGFEDVTEVCDGVDGLVDLESERFQLTDGQICRCRCRGGIHVSQGKTAKQSSTRLDFNAYSETASTSPPPISSFFPSVSLGGCAARRV